MSSINLANAINVDMDRQLEDALSDPPRNLTKDNFFNAFESLAKLQSSNILSNEEFTNLYTIYIEMWKRQEWYPEDHLLARDFKPPQRADTEEEEKEEEKVKGQQDQQESKDEGQQPSKPSPKETSAASSTGAASTTSQSG